MPLSLWLLAVAGLIALLAVRFLWRRRYAAGLLALLCTVPAAAAAYYSQQAALNLRSYNPILLERDIAELRVHETAQGREILIRDLVSNRSYRWQPKGGEWQMDLRVLRLSGVCASIDWPTHYRLFRLQTYETGAEGEKPVIHNVQLQQSEEGWDLWRGLRRWARKRPDLVDEIEACIRAEILESPMQALPDDGRFRASIREQGLHIRRLPH